MLIPYEYDPAIHKIVEGQVATTLRRETHIDNLVVYHHQIHNTWVISLRSLQNGNGPDQLLDIALCGSGDGDGHYLTREHRDFIVKMLKSLKTREEAHRLRRNKRREDLEKDDEAQRRRAGAVRSIYLFLKRKYGQMRADEWARMTSPAACTPEKFGSKNLVS